MEFFQSSSPLLKTCDRSYKTNAWPERRSEIGKLPREFISNRAKSLRTFSSQANSEVAKFSKFFDQYLTPVAIKLTSIASLKQGPKFNVSHHKASGLQMKIFSQRFQIHCCLVHQPFNEWSGEHRTLFSWKTKKEPGLGFHSCPSSEASVCVLEKPCKIVECSSFLLVRFYKFTGSPKISSEMEEMNKLNDEPFRFLINLYLIGRTFPEIPVPIISLQ